VWLTDSPFVTRIRQNHAVEHATMHLLAQSQPKLHLVGRSDWNGFTLYGDVETQAVLQAVTEGLARLKHAEGWLAVHPRCGTNLAVQTLLTCSAAYAAAKMPTHSWFKRLVGAGMALGGAFIVARPLGTAMQRYITTTTSLEGVHVKMVQRQVRSGLTVHRILMTRNDPMDSHALYSTR
jgi:hypothetical protein